MTIRVKLFAVLRDRAGEGEIALELRDQATAGDAVDALGVKFDALAGMLGRVAVAVNQEYVSRETRLKDGDEVALIPPVSGG